MRNFPSNDLASNAQFYLGEIYYAQNDFTNAIMAYDNVLMNYPRSFKLAASELKKGMAELEAGERTAGIRDLRSVESRFPGSDEARRAHAKLHEIGATTRHFARACALIGKASVPLAASSICRYARKWSGCQLRTSLLDRLAFRQIFLQHLPRQIRQFRVTRKSQGHKLAHSKFGIRGRRSGGNICCMRNRISRRITRSCTVSAKMRAVKASTNSAIATRAKPSSRTKNCELRARLTTRYSE